MSGSKILILEGLRGPLALWVLVTHTLQRSGYTVEDASGPIRFLRSGGNAVDVFVILSGFVITLMFVNKKRKEGYCSYLFKRYMRLAPALIVFLFLAALLSGIKGDFLENMPSGIEKTNLLAKYAHTQENFLSIFLSKFTLLYGAVPNEIIPNMSNGILEPAWSISLEWQFYLLAPLLVFGVVRRNILLLVGLFGFIYGVYFLGVVNGMSWSKSFIPKVLPLFVVGIISCLGFLSSWKLYKYFIVSGLAACSILALVVKGDVWSGPHLGLAIWAIVLASLYFPMNNPLKDFLECHWMCWLGKISYSIYLGHMPALVLSQLFLSTWGYSYSYNAFLLTLSTAVVSILFAYVVYNYVETPSSRIASNGIKGVGLLKRCSSM